MFNFTDLIYKIPNFLSDEECKSLIDEYEYRSNEFMLEHCPDANSGVDTYSSFKVINLNKNTSNFEMVFKKTEKAINLYLDYLQTFNAFHMPLMREASMLYSHSYRLMKYDAGSKIHPHTDHDPFVYGSITFNLNDEYTGGTFSFFNGQHTVELKKGEMMIWPADYFWVHEVYPVESGVRYSTNGFLQSLPVEVCRYARKIAYEMLDENYSEIMSLNSTIGPYNVKQIN
jgi:predicted 2-oxoglutarate/Fe(II)-dependent dioxygenase YbiX